MAQLTDLLVLLYSCNLLAEQAPPTQREAVACVAVLDEIKLAFLTTEEQKQLAQLELSERYRIMLRRYDRFKQWENVNQEYIANLLKNSVY